MVREPQYKCKRVTAVISAMSNKAEFVSTAKNMLNKKLRTSKISSVYDR